MKNISSVVLTAALCVPLVVFAQAFPARPIHMIVPFPPGGVDVTGRLISNKMTELIGQPVVLENRGGANGMIGSDFVAHSPADGYTILMTTPSTHITAVFLSKNVPYDPIKDFTPIVCAVEPATVLLTAAGLPVNSVKDLIEYAKKNPGKVSYSSSGIGSVFHLMGEAFAQAADVSIVHVPYKGTGPALADVVAGRIEMSFNALSTVRPQMTGGKIKVLAVAEGRRYPGLPGVPTVGEQLPGFEKPQSWFGFFGPAGLPRPLTSRLNTEIMRAVNSPDVRARLDEGALSVVGGSPEEFAALMKNGFEVYGRIVKAAGLKPE